MLRLNSKLAMRVILGLGMIISLGAVLAVEGWTASRDYFFLPAYWRGAGFAVLTSIFVLMGCREYFYLCRTKDYEPPYWVMIAGILLLVWQPYWGWIMGGDSGVALSAVAAAVILAAGGVLVARGRTDGAIGNLAAAGFGVIYLGLGGWFWVRIRLLGHDGKGFWEPIQYVVMFLACVKSSDIGAYFTGRFLGRHKWVPSVSPGKTWEGLAGGIVLAVIVSSLFAGIFDIIQYKQAILFGVVLALSGQIGDLVESLLKRDAGAKDSAVRVPEFGGILDVIDSILLSAPWAYFIFKISAE
jgi:phosphatidate cytidylyltransferase